MNFGAWLREHRINQGLFQSDVAKRAGVSVSYVSTLERTQPHSISGKDVSPTREKIMALAKAVGGSVDEALKLTGYASTDTDAFGLASELSKLPPDRQELAKRQIKAIIDSLADEGVREIPISGVPLEGTLADERDVRQKKTA